MNLRRYFLVAAVAASPAFAQQQQPAKTTEQQARSYVASAFMTGAAPVIMSETVTVSPSLRQHLNLDPTADGPAVYKAMTKFIAGKPVTVRRAAADEVAASEAPAPVSEQPIFALEAGDSTLLVQYDLARDNISFVGLPGAVATPAAVVAPTPPEKMAATPSVVPAAATGTVVETQKPAAAPEPKPLQVVEPQIPHMATPAATTAAAVPEEPPRPPLRKSGPCVIKPVMTDQDLVNCGATPR